MLAMNAGETKVDEFAELSFERKFEKLLQWIYDANDLWFGKVSKGKKNNRVKWWTDELE